MRIRCFEYRILYFCLSVLLLLNLVPCSNAQDATYSLQQISLEKGLSQSKIIALHRDQMGRLWLGTRNGLNRYDGVNMRNYFMHSEQPSGLLDNYIYFIAEDIKKNILVGTGKGLAIYDQGQDLFRQLPVESDSRSIVYSNFLHKGDSLILGTTNHLAIYTANNNQIKQLQFKGDAGTLQLLYKMVSVNNDQILIASRWHGLFHCNLKTGKLTKSSWIDDDNLLTIIKDHKGNFWISVYKKGLFKISSQGQLLHKYNTSNSALRSDIVLALCEIDNEIWIGTDGGGLQRLNPKSNLIKTVQVGAANNPALNSISEIFLDEYNNIWLGTINGGAFNLKEVYVTSYSDVSWGNATGLSSQTVLSLYAQSDETVWVGTDGGGINRYSLSKGNFQHFIETQNKKVNAIARLSEDELLINCFTEGLKTFNTRSGKLSGYRLKVLGEAHIPGQGFIGVSLINLTEDYVLVLDNNLQLINLSDRTIELISVPQLLSGEGGLKLAGQYNDDVYIYGQKGIYCYNFTKRSIELLYRLNNDEILKSAFVDKEKTIWFSTSKAFYQTFDNQKTTKVVDLGVLGAVTSIIGGNQSQLWIGAGRSIVMLDKKTGFVHRMGKSDGVLPNEYYDKANAVVDGHVLKGGANGLIHIREDQYFHKQDTVQLFVTDIKQNGQLVNEIFFKDYCEDNTIELPWNFGLLQFNLIIKTKDLFRDKTIKYSIQGFSEQFVETNDQRINIIGLNPGSYTVKAKVIDGDGVWTPAQTVMNVNVLPPWWQSLWFRLLSIIVAVIFIIVVWYVLYNRHLVKVRLEMQEKDRMLIEQKITFLTNVSHEIRTPLSLIYGPLELLLKDEHNNNNQELVNLVFRQVQYLKELVEQALNLERIENTDELLNPSAIRINQWLKSVVNGFYFELKNSGMQVAYELEEEPCDVWLDKQAMTKVVYNLIINVIKHAPETRILTISTHFINNDAVRVTFADEGPGIPEDKINNLFDRFYQVEHKGNGYGIGLAYAKTLVERHGGVIGAENNKHGGARFFFELPLKNHQLLSKETIPQASRNIDQDELADEGKIVITPVKKDILEHLTLLIVEDNAELAGYIKQLFKDLFKRVLVAYNGEEGLNKAINEMPDVILSDVMMPVMDGNEFCRRVKTTIDISHIPVILLTARHDEASIKQGYKMGADGYLTKPFSNDLLIDVICNVINSRLRVQESYKATLFNENAVTKITSSNADEKFLKKINQIIKDELDNPDLTVDMLVDRMAISRATLYNKFKSVLGIGINTYINDYRIAEAKSLLIHTNELLADIAVRIGFQSQSYFSTYFKQQTGLTPMQYRQKHKTTS